MTLHYQTRWSRRVPVGVPVRRVRPATECTFVVSMASSRLMDRMDEARAFSITPPERCFEAARKKTGAGHYDFDADNTEKQTDRSQQ